MSETLSLITWLHIRPDEWVETARSYTGPVLIEVHGNFAVWDYGITGGAPDDVIYPNAYTLYPSHAASNDAEWRYAWQVPGPSWSFPVANPTNFKVDRGTGWEDLSPIGGDPPAPSVDHRYFYRVWGLGHPLRFSIFDSYAIDNNGELRITVSRPQRGLTLGAKWGGGSGVRLAR